ncbi:hypothetical protein ACFPYJ_32655 [Paenibacillus solisilvae]|uniref:Uncharacterized protein n=1 Tax=Paenibacillus solisilvae TaxID=2486751 RepID=A0ABW0W6P3_9BACL
MNLIVSDHHQERVEAVVDIIKAVTGHDSVSDTFIDRMNKMNFEELGRLVMKIAATRTVDDSIEML